MAINYTDYFRGKKITVMGLGLLGRGVGDAAFLAECGADLIVTDLKSAQDLQVSVEKLKDFPNIHFVLGEHRLSDFRDRDMILKAAGVPLDSPYIEEARKHNVPVEMSASLFAKLAHIPTIGITGTRGKSTVTHLLWEILKGSQMDALLGGNVKGVSTLALLSQVKNNSIALFELDSWQCQGWGESRMSPNVAVFTTFLDDHMNYYKGNVDRYLADKANLFLYQSPADTLVIGTQALPFVKEVYGRKISSQVVVADSKKFPKDWHFSLSGEHNRYNAMCAIEAARVLGIDEDLIREGVEGFQGVPYRLELVGEVDGVKVYNDTTATTPDATIAALNALNTGKKNILLIMGGTDKELPMDALLREIPLHTKKVFLLSGSGTVRIQDALEGATVYSSLEEALAEAFRSAVAEDIILFSPAFASFGMFKNEFDRGEKFNEVLAKFIH